MQLLLLKHLLLHSRLCLRLLLQLDLFHFLPKTLLTFLLFPLKLKHPLMFLLLEFLESLLFSSSGLGFGLSSSLTFSRCLLFLFLFAPYLIQLTLLFFELPFLLFKLVLEKELLFIHLVRLLCWRVILCIGRWIRFVIFIFSLLSNLLLLLFLLLSPTSQRVINDLSLEVHHRCLRCSLILLQGLLDHIHRFIAFLLTCLPVLHLHHVHRVCMCILSFFFSRL